MIYFMNVSNAVIHPVYRFMHCIFTVPSETILNDVYLNSCIALNKGIKLLYLFKCCRDKSTPPNE